MTSEFKSILKKDFSINDKYKVILFLKKGINAENYRVEGTDGKLYFLKLFDYSKISSTSFNENKELTEIEIAKQLNHPNIVKYVDSGEVIISQKKYAFLVLDYIPGETLHEKIKREPLTNYYDIKLIAEGLLNGLVYLHSQESPIIHNEITPHNIMLDLSSGEPQVKIIDFGYARLFHSSTKAFNKEGKVTDEHCNGRTNCSKHLLKKIYKKEINTFDQFIEFLKNYCYTIKILSEENILVSSYLKKNKDKNFIEAYNELGIVICDEKGNVLEKIELPVI